MKFLVFATAFLAVASAYDVFYFSTPEHEEVVYKYYADVVTGVKDPIPYGSKFALRGDLHIRNDKAGNGTVFFLNNVEVFTYNGNEFKQVKPVWTPVPELAKAYLTPFYVGYTSDGTAEELFFQQGEPEWVYNIKKAIASTFQLDWVDVTKYVKKVPYAFQTFENTIYGRCHVSYEVDPCETEYVITKYINPRACEGFVEERYTNLVSHQCFADHDDIFSTVAERKFFVSKEGVIRKVQAEYMAFGYIFKVQENMQFVSVNQNFTFVDFVAPTTTIDFTSFVQYQPIVYQPPRFTKTIPDLTFGFYEFDKEYYVNHVRNLLIEAVEYMEKLTVNTDVPTTNDIKEGQAINRIYYIVRMFTIDEFNKVFESLYKSSDKKDIRALEFFYKILPNVGTYYSAIFIRDLIANQKVKDYVATKLLYTLGVNFPYVAEDYLSDFEVFYQWNVPNEVKHASILTFATMVNKAYQEIPHSANVEKYIKYYYNQLKTATVYEEQLIWLQGLSNIRVGSVYDLLRPIVFGEQVLEHAYDRHLRVQAIWSMLHVMEDLHIDVFETFWPILVNDELNLELRVAALKGILYLGDVSELRYVFQWIQDAHNIHLYNFFYHTVRDVAHSEVQCDQRTNRTIFFEQLEQHFSDFPIQASTTAFIRDDYDESTGYGFYYYGNAIANEETNHINQIFIKFSEIVSHEMASSFGIAIKFEGIEYPIDTFFSDFYNFTVDTFRGKLFKRSNEPIHVEITVTYFDQIVFVKYFDEKTVENLFSAEFLNLISLMKFRFFDVFYTMQKEVYFPTDFGVTGNFYMQIPLVLYLNSEVPHFINDNTAMEVKYDFKLRAWSHAVNGMSVYNPLAAMVQGVRRIYAFDVNVPLNYVLRVDYEENKVSAKSSKRDDELYDVLGIKTHVSSQVYIYPDRRIDVLAQTCADCLHTVAATHTNDVMSYNSTIFDYHSRFTGLQYYFGIYEAEYAPQDFKHFGFPVDHLSFDIFTSFGDYTFSKYVLGAYNWFIRNAFVYPRGNFGFAIFSTPCQLYPVDFWQWTTTINRIPRSRSDEATFMDYAYTVNVTVNTTTKNDDVVTSFDMDFNFDHFHGQVFNDFEFQISEKVASEDIYSNYCFKRSKDWQTSRVTFDYDFWYGTSYARECVTDEYRVSVRGYGEKSPEQLSEDIIENPYHTYSACRPHLPWQRNSNSMTTYQCALAQVSFRKYHFKVQYESIPTNVNNYLEYFLHYLITAYRPRYTTEAYRHVVDDSFDVDYIYPVDFHEQTVQAVITFPGHSYVFDNFPITKYGWLAYPDNPYVPRLFQFAKQYNHYNSCAVYPQQPKFTLPHVHLATFPTSQDWTLYAANAPTNYTWAAYVKKYNDHDIAVKFIFNEGWVIVKPVESEEASLGHTRFSITTNDKFFKYFATEYSGSNYHHVQIWYVQNTVYFTLADYGMIWYYNGEGLYVLSIDTDHQYYGVCYQ